MPSDIHNLYGTHPCGCGIIHPNESIWLNSARILKIHENIERRINKLEQPVLGKKGGVDREQVLKIIEEEFGKLDTII